MEVTIDRKVLWSRAAIPAAHAPTPQVIQKQVATTTKTSNHAGVNFKRSLTEQEEVTIKVEFLKLNGIFEPNKKDCTRIRNLIGGAVTVFQVTGYVTRLHKEVMSGELIVPNRATYLASLRSHRKHWLTYNGEKYNAMRAQVEATGRKPKFTVRVPGERSPIRRHRMAK